MEYKIRDHVIYDRRKGIVKKISADHIIIKFEDGGYGNNIERVRLDDLFLKHDPDYGPDFDSLKSRHVAATEGESIEMNKLKPTTTEIPSWKDSQQGYLELLKMRNNKGGKKSKSRKKCKSKKNRRRKRRQTKRF